MLWHQKEKVHLQQFYHSWVPPLKFHATWATDLSSLSRAFPRRWEFSAIQIVQNHCIFPFYAPFVPPTVREAQLVWANNRTGLFPPTLRFIAELSVGRDFKACPKCVQEDSDEFGEPYFHRTHHLPGIGICLRHLLPLTKVASEKLTASKIKDNLQKLADSPVPHVSEATNSFLPFLASSVAYLLARPLDLDVLDLRILYRVRLTQVDLGKVAREPLLLSRLKESYERVREFIQIGRWPRDFIASLKSHRPLSLSPVFHLVLQHFLGLTPETALRHANGFLWNCPNRLSDCGPVQVKLHNRFLNKPTISCEKCGLVASVQRSQKIGARAKIQHLLDCGPVLREVLLKLKSKRLNTYALARNLGVPRSIVLEIVEGKRRKSEDRAERMLQKRDEARQILLEWMQAHPNGKRSHFHRANPKTYNFFFIHDREWYDATAPPSAQNNDRHLRHMRSLQSRKSRK